MIGLWWVALAGAAGPDDLVEPVGHGVRVNWTTLQLEVEASARGQGTQSVQAVEVLARREVEAAVQQAVGSVRVTSDARVADLLADEGPLAAAIRSRTSRWQVAEAVYGTTGKVTLRAELSLQELLKPWTTSIARAGVAPAPAPETPTEPTGLLIDARGTGARPAYAVRLLDPAGQAVYAGELWEAQAVTLAPYRYVTDPAHPEAATAGARPVLLRAVEAREADLVLSAEDAARVAEVAERVLARGAVVVVLDAP